MQTVARRVAEIAEKMSAALPYHLIYKVTAQQMKDWAKMMDIELVHITKGSTVDALETEITMVYVGRRLAPAE